MSVAAPVTQYKGERMPLSKRKTIGEHIAEFHTGQTYARTKRKFGKARANKQAIAVAYATKRRRKTIAEK
jgi:hypothetical protein